MVPITTPSRLGILDQLTVRILTDIVLSLDDKWLDDFEELAHQQLPDFEDADDDIMEKWDLEVEKLQDRVMKRVAGALTHYAADGGNNDRLVREMRRLLGEEPDPPHHAIAVSEAPSPAVVYGV